MTPCACSGVDTRPTRVAALWNWRAPSRSRVPIWLDPAGRRCSTYPCQHCGRPTPPCTRCMGATSGPLTGGNPSASRTRRAAGTPRRPRRTRSGNRSARLGNMVSRWGNQWRGSAHRPDYVDDKACPSPKPRPARLATIRAPWERPTRQETGGRRSNADQSASLRPSAPPYQAEVPAVGWWW